MHLRPTHRVQANAVEQMARSVTYSVVNDPDGRFAVMAESGSRGVHWRCGFLTLAEAELCVEDLRAIMTACGSALVYCKAEPRDIDLSTMLKAPRPPSR